MVGRRLDAGVALCRNRVLLIARAWVVGLLALSIVAVSYEESGIVANDAFDRVTAAVGIAFIGVPVIAGILHRSLRVAGFVASFALVGWLIAHEYADWADNHIGGGP